MKRLILIFLAVLTMFSSLSLSAQTVKMQAKAAKFTHPFVIKVRHHRHHWFRARCWHHRRHRRHHRKIKWVQKAPGARKVK